MTPPAFADAVGLRQKVRAAGLDPNHWYAVEYERRLPRRAIRATSFWGAAIVLWRDIDGRVHALEDRCAHRQLPLSLGSVEGCRLVCAYHGWTYDDGGRLVDVPHDRFGHPMPSVHIRHHPVRERYGLIWIFPGDPTLAVRVPLPEVPVLEGSEPWAYAPIDFTWRAHHSMVMDNLCDLTHAHLHRRFASFQPGRLLDWDATDDRVLLRYEAKVGPRVRHDVAPSPMTISFEYPYHWAAFEWSGIRGQIRYWTFLLPMDVRTTCVFFVMAYDRLRVPGLPASLPHRALRWVLAAIQPFVRSLLDQDGVALEAEQRGYEAHWDAPLVELNPAVALLHRLTIRKWEAHLARAGAAGVPA